MSTHTVQLPCSVVIHKRTGRLAEKVNNTCLGSVIFLIDTSSGKYEKTLLKDLGKKVIYDDEKRFKNYEDLGLL